MGLNEETDLQEEKWSLVRELRDVVRLVIAERESSYAMEMIRSYGKEKNNVGIITPISQLVKSVNNKEDVMWLMWGVDKASFKTRKNFILFCSLAGVDPSKVTRWGSWESSDWNYRSFYWF